MTMNVSRLICRYILREDRAFCAYAWQHKDSSCFWSGWVRVFGKKHCHSSYLKYKKIHNGDSYEYNRNKDAEK
jgi:hypothetical protein